MRYLLITPMSQHEYDAINRARAADGMGPLLKSYDKYLELISQHNAAVETNRQYNEGASNV